MSEIHEQIRVCYHIKGAYPESIFYSDLSGLRFSAGVARLVKLLRSDNGFTDLMILKPSGPYFALFIEMKKTGEKIYKKDGITYKTDHLIEQADMIKRLNQLGYRAGFCIGEDNTIKAINAYMNEEFEKLNKFFV